MLRGWGGVGLVLGLGLSGLALAFRLFLAVALGVGGDPDVEHVVPLCGQVRAVAGYVVHLLILVVVPGVRSPRCELANSGVLAQKGVGATEELEVILTVAPYDDLWALRRFVAAPRLLSFGLALAEIAVLFGPQVPPRCER